MSEQRYRPLAFGERIEEGDECKSTENLPGVIYKWGMAYGHEGNRVGDIDGYTYRRPIPETNWREPVGEAGYPYPQGTVVEEENYALWLCSEFHEDSLAVRVHKTGDGSYQVENSIWLDKDCNRTMRHRVIDYCPDLVNQQNNVGSEGMGIRGEEGQPETDPRDQSDEPCCSCQAELTRLRAEVERYVAECERLRIKCGKSEMVEGDYATLCILTDERDKLRVRVECWEAKWKSLLKMHTEVINLMEKHSE